MSSESSRGPRRRRVRLGAPFLLVCFATPSGCGALLGVDFGAAVLDVDGGTDARSSDEGAGPTTDAASDSPLVGDAGRDARGPCDYPQGPVMVEIPASPGASFCIDSTEVRQKDYAAFLAARNGDNSGQIAECATNEFALAPSCLDPAGHGDYAAGCTDWCDAVAYCAWAGKHLCGHIGGGPFNSATEANTNVDEWFMACSHNNDGLHTFPYGPAAQPGLCNDAKRDAGPQPVGSLPGCVGGYPGLFDMSGNLNEWTFDCKSDHSYCGVRGGYFKDGPITCGRQPEFGVPPTNGGDTVGSDPNIGFRCCANILR